MSTENPGTQGPRVQWVHCNECGRKTKHTVLVERKQPGSEDVGEGISIDWLTTWTTLECCGCESVCLRKSFWFSEWDRDDPEKVEFFPPPIARRSPDWLERLGPDEQALLKEVYNALYADSRRLAMMGARALVDMVMRRHVGDMASFAAQLEALKSQGWLSVRQQNVLEAALDAGSAAAHRGHLASHEDAETVMDIVENLLQSELLDAVADGLRARTPPRPPRQRRAAPPSSASGQRGDGPVGGRDASGQGD